MGFATDALFEGLLYFIGVALWYTGKGTLYVLTLGRRKSNPAGLFDVEPAFDIYFQVNTLVGLAIWIGVVKLIFLVI